jgi:hypothetical protein
MKNYTEILIEVGEMIYCNDEGEWHRTDGPAIIEEGGKEYWYVNGKKHRIDGPAIVQDVFDKRIFSKHDFWYINDFRLEDYQIDKLQNLRKVFNDDDLLSFLLLEGKIKL